MRPHYSQSSRLSASYKEVKNPHGVQLVVLSYVQKEATTPNIVGPIMLGVDCTRVVTRVGSGMQTDAVTPVNVGTCSASLEV